MIVSPRNPIGPQEREFPIDAQLLQAGDHNGATFYQHERFLSLVRGRMDEPDVTFDDGAKAVLVGKAAQQSAETGEAVLMQDFCR